MSLCSTSACICVRFIFFQQLLHSTLIVYVASWKDMHSCLFNCGLLWVYATEGTGLVVVAWMATMRGDLIPAGICMNLLSRICRFYGMREGYSGGKGTYFWNTDNRYSSNRYSRYAASNRGHYYEEGNGHWESDSITPIVLGNLLWN